MDPTRLTIVKGGRLIQRGELTPTEFLEAHLEKIKRLDPRLEAWVTVDEEGARADADRLTKEAKNGHIRSPLHGVPVGVKDIFYTKSLRTTMGSPLYADYVPDIDSAVVSRLRELGAIIIGKTHTTEFANHDPAPTRNPWNPSHTPGGSSSGSAVAVASEMCPLAFGTQTGGSVTRPASYCGVVGVKPTYDLLSREGVYPLSWSLDHVGFFTRTVEDAEITLKALTKRRTAARIRSPPRIGVPNRYFRENADCDASKGFGDAVEKLEKAGVEVATVKLPESFDYAHSVHRVIMSAEAAAVHERLFKTQMGKYRPYIRGQVVSGLLIRAATYIKAQSLKTTYQRELAEALKPFDVVATPSTTTAAPEGLAWTGDPAFNTPWSLSGFPTVTIPSGLSEGGLPLGLQLAAPPNCDERLLSIARWCEGRLGFDTSPTIPQ